MQTIKELIVNFFNLANAMSIYILLGLIIAGILKELLPKDFIYRHLGSNKISSVIKATILGIPMPVCSCSVVPLAKSLQKEGASAGAVQSFLISTPITGVDSILATYSFFGWFFTIYRVITSIIIAIVAGILQNLFYKPKIKKVDIMQKPQQNIAVNNLSFSKNINFKSQPDSCDLAEENKRTFSIKRVFNYAFNILFSDIAKSLFIGLILGAIFTTFLPKELIAMTGDNLVVTYLIILLISMPMYVCATSSLPIGAS